MTVISSLYGRSAATRFWLRVGSVRDWPPITERELLERLALDDEQFVANFRALSTVWGRREFQRTVLEWALAYPWERPAASYILRGSEVQLLEDIEATERVSTVGAFVE